MKRLFCLLLSRLVISRPQSPILRTSRLISSSKSESSLALKTFATVHSYTSTKVVSGVSSDGRTLFIRAGRKVYFGL